MQTNQQQNINKKSSSRNYLLSPDLNNIAITKTVIKEGDLPTKRLITERNAIKVDALYVFHKKVGYMRLFEFFWIVLNFTENGYVTNKERMYRYMRGECGYTQAECLNMMRELRRYGLVEDRAVEGATSKRSMLMFVPYGMNIDWNKPDMKLIFEVFVEPKKIA